MTETADLMNRLADALESADLDALVACWHPDVETTHVLRPNRSWHGQDFYRQAMGQVYASGQHNGVKVLDRGIGVTGDRFYIESLTSHADGTVVPCLTIYIVQDGAVRWARVYTDRPQEDGESMMDWIAAHNE
jgi:hypothetical protein